MRYAAIITLIIAATLLLVYLMATTSRAMGFPQPQTQIEFECYMMTTRQQVCVFNER
jgi:hypothetical protein